MAAIKNRKELLGRNIRERGPVKKNKHKYAQKLNISINKVRQEILTVDGRNIYPARNIRQKKYNYSQVKNIRDIKIQYKILFIKNRG